MNFFECVFNPVGCAADAAFTTVLEGFAQSIGEALGQALAALGTFWVLVPTQSVSVGSAGPGVGGVDDPFTEMVSPVLGWVTWFGALLAVLSFVGAALLALVRLHSGRPVSDVGRLGVVLVGVGVLGSVSSVGAAVMPGLVSGDVWADAGGPAGFFRVTSWWLVGVMLFVSITVGAVKTFLTQRLDALKELGVSVLRLVVVAGGGVALVEVLTRVGDAYSVWILGKSLECSDLSCFDDTVMSWFSVTGPVVGLVLVIVLGFIALLAALVQTGLLLVRNGMISVLVGLLPLSASFTNMEIGQSWFRRHVSWLLAAVLYKPVAATVYAGAFVFTGRSGSLLDVLTGVFLMIVSVVALGALMRLVAPTMAAVAGAGGGAAAGAVVAGGAMAAVQAFGGGASGAGAQVQASGQTNVQVSAGDSPPAGGLGGAPGVGAPAGDAGSAVGGGVRSGVDAVKGVVGVAAPGVGSAVAAGVSAVEAVADGARGAAESVTGDGG